MKKRINIIKEIYYAKVSDVSYYQQTTEVFGKVKIDTTEWIRINKSAAPATLNIKEDDTTAGRQYSSDISLAIKEPVIVPEPVILRVDLCDGDSVIVGSVELPVRIESTIQLITKRLDISHKSWHYPTTLIV